MKPTWQGYRHSPCGLLGALALVMGCGQSSPGSSRVGQQPGPAHKAPPGSVFSLANLDLKAVWGTGPTDVWAVGAAGAIVHYDGHAWAPSTSGITENLTGVAGTSSTSAWITSDQGTVLQWDGHKWSIASQVADTELLALWAGDPANVWAVGVDLSGGGSGYLRQGHFDEVSATWTWQDTDVTITTSLWQAWGSGPNDIWLVGDGIDGSGVAIRGDGSTANPFDLAGYSGPPLRGVWGTGPNDVWLEPYQGPMSHWDGTSWTPVSTTEPGASLLGIGGSGTDIWAVGLAGVVLHYVDGAWVASPVSTTSALWSVWASGPSDVWVVGGAGALLHWNGLAWAKAQ
jgi:hypothetical protein